MLPKTFEPAEAEARLYALWEQQGAFAADPASAAEPYAIMIPPPNVTGNLHVGHALTMTLQDVLIRWRRMQGRDALWQPGSDHSGISLQMMVDRLLRSEGSSARDQGREGFLKRAWAWKDEYGDGITRQLRRLGASLDWPRARFTLDDGLSAAVRKVFVRLHEQGLIYRDRRLVNWDPLFQSALSDLEVENREVKGSLWHLRYPLESDRSQFIVVATTRPETMLGDVAVAVHPDDDRYKALVGQNVILPLTGRRIPIIADPHSDPEKGSGAVKITPAHDFNDFAVGKRHNLPMPSILDLQACIMLDEIAGELRAEPGLADPDFVLGLAGQDRFKARDAIVAEFERLELLEKIEPHMLALPHAERGGAVVEPLLSTQWFCDAVALAEQPIRDVEDGTVQFVPKAWENTFFAWMRNIQPWCISRQLWWGHRIPAWYGPDGKVFVADDEQIAAGAAAAHYGAPVALTQDEDVLDTWFSSALWPFATQGWPAETPELARYYPGNVLVTGFDIIPFWVARMMMMGRHLTGKVPFHTVYIHGLVRDERGQKMSKTKGNVIDPLALIDAYGTDALRFTVCSLAGPGRDLRLGRARVESERAFVTKLWNAARFCEMNGVAPDASFGPETVRSNLAQWLLVELNQAVAEATRALEVFRFDEYARCVYGFTWKIFCDWFLEFSKPVFNENTDEAIELRQTAAYALGVILRLLHPAMPFVTEELWGRFGYGASGSLIRAAWPHHVAPQTDWAVGHHETGQVQRLIAELRAVRSDMNVPPSVLAPLLLRDASMLALAERWREAVRRMGRVSEIEHCAGEPPAGSAQISVDGKIIAVKLAGLIDLDAERARLAKERDRLAKEKEKTEAKLANADFVQRAKPEVVEENRERVASWNTEIARLEAAIARIA